MVENGYGHRKRISLNPTKRNRHKGQAEIYLQDMKIGRLPVSNFPSRHITTYGNSRGSHVNLAMLTPMTNSSKEKGRGAGGRSSTRIKGGQGGR